MHQPRVPVRPTCPFCRADWTDAMLDQYARYTVAGPCGCCGGDAHDIGDAPALPTEDLCCVACGRAIYLKPLASAP